MNYCYRTCSTSLSLSDSRDKVQSNWTEVFSVPSSLSRGIFRSFVSARQNAESWEGGREGSLDLSWFSCPNETSDTPRFRRIYVCLGYVNFHHATPIWRSDSDKLSLPKWCSARSIRSRWRFCSVCHRCVEIYQREKSEIFDVLLNENLSATRQSSLFAHMHTYITW